MNQAAVTVADILRQAERIGWTVSDTRAAEIAAVAAPAYAALERSSAELDFDVDTLSLYAALQENRAPPPSDAPAPGPMAPPPAAATASLVAAALALRSGQVSSLD
ncbi:MAG: hypothetical protein RL342_618, partial [Pseudomonadota bacterium]